MRQELHPNDLQSPYSLPGIHATFQHVAKHTRVLLYPHLLLGLFGIGWAFTLEVGVRLYWAEILSVTLLPFVPWRSTLARFPALRKILAAYLLWIVAIIVSDFINHTTLIDVARAAATPLLGGISLIFATSCLMKNQKALFTFLFCIAVSKGIFGEPAYGDKFAEETLNWQSILANTNYFKVRVVPFLLPAIALIACTLATRSLVTPAMLLLVSATLFFSVDARSVGLAFFLSAAILLAFHFQFRPTMRQFALWGALATIVCYSSYAGYVSYTLNSNAEGHNAKQLSRLENPYNPLELIAQGRSEWLIAVDAISERPVVGHGSWAKDIGHKYTHLRVERAGLERTDSRENFGDWQMIPVHSVVVAMWLWSGLLGLFAGIYLLKVFLTYFGRLHTVQSTLLPATLIFAVLTFWDLFFSPPQSVRLSFPIAFATLIVLSAANYSLLPIPRFKRQKQPSAHLF